MRAFRTQEQTDSEVVRKLPVLSFSCRHKGKRVPMLLAPLFSLLARLTTSESGEWFKGLSPSRQPCHAFHPLSASNSLASISCHHHSDTSIFQSLQKLRTRSRKTSLLPNLMKTKTRMKLLALARSVRITRQRSSSPPGGKSSGRR
jgi:hypothetical protein